MGYYAEEGAFKENDVTTGTSGKMGEVYGHPPFWEALNDSLPLQM